MAECPHMPGADPDWCGICTPRATSIEAEDRGTVIVATFDSDCHRCGGGIYEGERMMIKDGEYLCADHTPDPPERAARRIERSESDPTDPFA